MAVIKIKNGIDLTDRRFGKLIAKEKTNQLQDRYCVWHCKCDCGGEILVNTKRLMRGTVTNCGCIPKMDAHNGPNAESLIGRQFGDLTVIERVENQNGRVYWKCKCSCGEEKVASAACLKNGKTKTCGKTIHQKNRRSIDLTGFETGFIRVIEKTEQRDYKGSVIWHCICLRCGKECFYSEDALKHGNNISCGCYRQEKIMGEIHNQVRLIDGTCIDWLGGKRKRSDNTSGFRGVNQVASGNFRSMIGFKRKRYVIGTYKTFNEAVQARIEAEELIHNGFIRQYNQWIPRAKLDPAWAEENPLIFEVEKVNGELIVITERKNAQIYRK